jgi:predicted RNA-binding protein YlxR (DUF448 family)
VGCNRTDAKSELRRFVLVDGRAFWAARGGRGAYLHPRPECATALLARKPFLRSLRASISKEERARLIAEAVRTEGSEWQKRA